MLKLTSKPNCIYQVETYVKRLVKKHKLSSDMYPNILISLTEAVNNAILHGNHNDETKEVHILTKKENELLRFIVSDEGKGFDFQNVPDPTSPENLEKVGGRGVFLMCQLSDQVRFYNNGSTVELVFRL
jgi:serine/threonine-protein kinase RsbW